MIRRPPRSTRTDTRFPTRRSSDLVQDPNALALALGLIVKELPFLLLMTLAALGQVRADERLAVARSLGYGPVTAWLKAVLPAVYRQLRLPVYAVLAYGPIGRATCRERA